MPPKEGKGSSSDQMHNARQAQAAKLRAKAEKNRAEKEEASQESKQPKKEQVPQNPVSIGLPITEGMEAFKAKSRTFYTTPGGREIEIQAKRHKLPATKLSEPHKLTLEEAMDTNKKLESVVTKEMARLRGENQQPLQQQGIKLPPVKGALKKEHIPDGSQISRDKTGEESRCLLDLALARHLKKDPSKGRD